MSGNPFEPPKTTDLDSVGATTGTAGTRFTLSAEALQELITAAPLVRWLTRLISLSIAVGLVHAITDLVRSGSAISKAARLLTTALGAGIWTLTLIVLRRYSTASNLLRPGEPAARGHVIGAQASYVRLLGVLAIIGLALFVAVAALALLLGGGYLVGRHAVGR
jgi:hypothetical protein